MYNKTDLKTEYAYA